MLHQMMFNPDGRKRAAITGYAASRSSSESYKSSSEQVVEFRSQAPPMMMVGNHKNSPKKTDYRDHEMLSGNNNSFLVPWGSPRGYDHRLVHDHQFSPKKQLHGHDQRKDSSSPRNYGNSSDQRFHGTKQDHYDNYYNESSDYEDYDDDDLKCDDRVCVREDYKDKGKSYDSGNRKGNYNSHDRRPSNYNVPSDTYDDHQPKKDPHHEKSYPNSNHSNNVKYKGNGYNSSPRSYTADQYTNSPKKGNTYMNYNEKLDKGKAKNAAFISSQPRTEPTHYEPSSHGNYPIENSLAPIRTRPNYPTRGSMDFPNEKPKNNMSAVTQQPNYNSSPKARYHHREYDDHETIDSNEARRRYARSSPQAAGPTVVEENYLGTINSREAARRYNGVFVT